MEIKTLLESVVNDTEKNNNAEVLKQCFGFIDLTSLNTTDTEAKINAMTDKVNAFGAKFPEFPHVAAMCVYPNFASTVRSRLEKNGVKIAVVAGVFPNSQSFTEVKELECKMAVVAGADEVDIVLSLSHFLSGNYEKAAAEIAALKKSIGKAHLKVILETGAIADSDLIYKASVIAMEAGADFIKTSTGKQEPAATPEAAIVMCSAIKDYYSKTGKKIGFKPAGGIVTKEDAILYYTIVEKILGKEWLNPELFRLGASRLANNLLSAIMKTDIKYF